MRFSARRLIVTLFIGCFLVCAADAAKANASKAYAAKANAAKANAPKASTIKENSAKDTAGKQNAVKENAADTSSLPCTNYISIIADNGLVIDELRADEVRPPASMIKLMLMMLVAEGLDAGKWTPDTPITASTTAAAVGGTHVNLKVNDTFTLNQYMCAVAVASANNAATAVAEGLWGSIDDYLKVANERAQTLGLKHTVLHSVHGLPPAAGQLSDETCARDMAILASQCVRHPQIMNWVGLREVTLQPTDSPIPATNKLLFSLQGCDGLKTGYTRAAGFCLTATAVRNDVRLITVVMGCDRLSQRFEAGATLMNRAFENTKRVRVLTKGDLVNPAVQLVNAKENKLQLAIADDVWIVVPAKDEKEIKLVPTSPVRLRAPLDAGTVEGTVRVDLGGNKMGEASLVVPNRVEEPGWRWKLTHSVLNRVEGENTAQGG